jgi:hypothetical protein
MMAAWTTFQTVEQYTASRKLKNIATQHMKFEGCSSQVVEPLQGQGREREWLLETDQIIYRSSPLASSSQAIAGHLIASAQRLLFILPELKK